MLTKVKHTYYLDSHGLVLTEKIIHPVIPQYWQ